MNVESMFVSNVIELFSVKDKEYGTENWSLGDAYFEDAITWPGLVDYNREGATI